MIKNRQQKRAQKTRQKIKEAALDVFAEKSIDAATVEDITEKADLGKGTLYHHFGDKEEIIITLVEDAVTHLIEYLHPSRQAPETLEDMLELLLDAHYRFLQESSEEFLLLFQGRVMVKLQSDHLGELEEPYLRYLKEIEEQVSKYLPPKVSPLKIRRIACAVAGFVFGFLSFAMIGMNPGQIDGSIAPLRQVFVKGLSEFLGK